MDRVALRISTDDDAGARLSGTKKVDGLMPRIGRPKGSVAFRERRPRRPRGPGPPRDDRIAKYRARPDLDVGLPVRPKDEAMDGYSLPTNGLPQRPLTASTDPGYIASKARRTWNMA